MTLSATEQAAWGIVVATVVVGLLAAIATAAAAWQAKKAAKMALDIATADRKDRKQEALASEAAANLRAALALQAPIGELRKLADIAVKALCAAQAIVNKHTEYAIIYFDSAAFPYTIYALNHRDMDRIGNLDRLAINVTGDFGAAVIRALAWSKEASAVVQKVINLSDSNSLHMVATHWVQDALKACRLLLHYSDEAEKKAVLIAGTPMDPGLEESATQQSNNEQTSVVAEEGSSVQQVAEASHAPPN
ncbi:hypothetical protein [Dyella kyungheensis]|uniref:Uncharacterized protein n=1 Tax=Dyella kyungheensis TaxID=1242174 RepID=A0ABS2JUG9_9GAMM|nr:hypothetical protein [Dyella kyungheensis]MBM7121930.1 hypothetical protein [Dyella kyungheensis]